MRHKRDSDSAFQKFGITHMWHSWLLICIYKLIISCCLLIYVLFYV